MADDEYDFSGISSDIEASVLAQWRSQNDEEEDDDYSYFWPDQPPYDIEEKLREINKVHEEDDTPLESNRPRRVKFNNRVQMRAISMRRIPPPADEDDEDEPFDLNKYETDEKVADTETAIKTPHPTPKPPAPQHASSVRAEAPQHTSPVRVPAPQQTSPLRAPTPYARPASKPPFALPSAAATQHRAKFSNKTAVSRVGRGGPRSFGGASTSGFTEHGNAARRGFSDAQNSQLPEQLAEDCLSVLSLTDDDADCAARPVSSDTGYSSVTPAEDGMEVDGAREEPELESDPESEPVPVRNSHTQTEQDGRVPGRDAFVGEPLTKPQVGLYLGGVGGRDQQSTTKRTEPPLHTAGPVSEPPVHDGPPPVRVDASQQRSASVGPAPGQNVPSDQQLTAKTDPVPHRSAPPQHRTNFGRSEQGAVSRSQPAGDDVRPSRDVAGSNSCGMDVETPVAHDSETAIVESESLEQVTGRGGADEAGSYDPEGDSYYSVSKSEDRMLGSTDDQASHSQESGSDEWQEQPDQVSSESDVKEAEMEKNKQTMAVPLQSKGRHVIRRPSSPCGTYRKFSLTTPEPKRTEKSQTTRKGTSYADRGKAQANRKTSPVKMGTRSSPERRLQRPRSAPIRITDATAAASHSSAHKQHVNGPSVQMPDVVVPATTRRRATSQDPSLSFQQWLVQHEKERAQALKERKNSAKRRKQEATIKKEQAPQAFRVWLRKKRQQKQMEQRVQQLRQQELMTEAAANQCHGQSGEQRDAFRLWLERKQQARAGAARPRPQATLRCLAGLYSVHPPYPARGGVRRPATASPTRPPYADLRDIYGPHAGRGGRSRSARLPGS